MPCVFHLRVEDCLCAFQPGHHHQGCFCRTQGLLRKVEEGPPYPHGPPRSLEHRPLVLGLESQPYWGLAPLEAPYKVAL